jgi:hypothetical protein
MTARKEGRRAVMKEFFPNGMTRKKNIGLFSARGVESPIEQDLGKMKLWRNYEFCP